MKSLEECRIEIDAIDRELVELLVKRMYTTMDVAIFKKEHELPVYDAERERLLLDKVRQLAGAEYEDAVLAVYDTILTKSKQRQMQYIDEH